MKITRLRAASADVTASVSKAPYDGHMIVELSVLNERPIRRGPRHLCVVLDVSHSMKPYLPEIFKALREVVMGRMESFTVHDSNGQVVLDKNGNPKIEHRHNPGLREGDRASVIAFDDTARLIFDETIPSVVQEDTRPGDKRKGKPKTEAELQAEAIEKAETIRALGDDCRRRMASHFNEAFIPSRASETNLEAALLMYGQLPKAKQVTQKVTNEARSKENGPENKSASRDASTSQVPEVTLVIITDGEINCGKRMPPDLAELINDKTLIVAVGNKAGHRPLIWLKELVNNKTSINVPMLSLERRVVKTRSDEDEDEYEGLDKPFVDQLFNEVLIAWRPVLAEESFTISVTDPSGRELIEPVQVNAGRLIHQLDTHQVVDMPLPNGNFSVTIRSSHQTRVIPVKANELRVDLETFSRLVRSKFDKFIADAVGDQSTREAQAQNLLTNCEQFFKNGIPAELFAYMNAAVRWFAPKPSAAASTAVSSTNSSTLSSTSQQSTGYSSQSPANSIASVSSSSSSTATVPRAHALASSMTKNWRTSANVVTDDMALDEPPDDRAMLLDDPVDSGSDAVSSTARSSTTSANDPRDEKAAKPSTNPTTKSSP